MLTTVADIKKKPVQSRLESWSSQGMRNESQDLKPSTEVLQATNSGDETEDEDQLGVTTIVSRKNKTSGKTMGTDSSMTRTRRWMGTSENDCSIIDKNKSIGD